MASSDDLLTISAFARRVGLTPSALRFYDDCGVLRPVRVDDGTGYRYYTAEQESRGRLLRDLRAVDLPLAEVRTVLDGPPAESARILQTHVRAAADKAAAARLAAARILDALPRAELSCAVTLAGPEFASAVRQVAPSAADVDVDAAGLTGVLLELDADEVSLVATDRYRLAVRRLRPIAFAGRARPVVVPADELTALRAWSAAADVVELSVGDGVARVARDGEVRELSVLPGYPGYRTMMDGLPPTTSRAIVSRSRLLEQLSGLDRTVAVEVRPDQVVVGTVALDAICSGAPVRLGFTAAVLAAAVSDGVGPDVLLEIGPSYRPVVVRSADQGTFTTLVMPAGLDA